MKLFFQVSDAASFTQQKNESDQPYLSLILITC